MSLPPATIRGLYDPFDGERFGIGHGAGRAWAQRCADGALARNLFNLHAAQGQGSRDFSSIVELYLDKQDPA